MNTEARMGTMSRPAVTTVEPDFASRSALISSVMWLVAASGVGLYVRLLELYPGLSFGIEFLSYGRVRTMANMLLVFGWLTMAGFAAVFVIIPRVAMTQLHNEVLGAATSVAWSMLMFGGIATSLFGMNQGRFLAELPFGLDVGLTLCLVLVLFNVGVTIVRRRERTLYVSAWYLLAGVLLVPVVYALGNVPVFEGVIDGIVNGWYRGGLELLWLLPVGLGIAHYVTPLETGNALYSAAAARAAFWSLMFVGGWTGQRFLLKGPAPDYLEVIATAMTFVLAVPLVTAVTNLLATGRGRWGLAAESYGLRFVAAALGLALLWYGLVVVGATPSIARLVGPTVWQSGVQHLALFGVFSFFAFGLIYHAYPRLVGRNWWSPALCSLHFWTSLAGVVLGAAALCAGGIASGTVTATWSRLGTERTVAVMAREIAWGQRGFAWAALAAFAAVAAAQLVFAYNVVRTSRSGPIMAVAPFVAGGSA